MKIGILTFHNSYNFGANLQTLATQEMLRMLGHKPVIVNFVDEPKLTAFARLVPAEQVAAHEVFAKRYYHLSPTVTRPDEVYEYCREELDGVVSGSDAVFRLAAPYAPRLLARKLLGRANPYETFSWDLNVPPFFLPFEAPGLIKGSLAASSRGTPFYFLRPSMIKAVGDALRDFDFVTVRDDWTGTLVRWLSRGGATPLYSCDPVFGLNSAFDLPEDEKQAKDLSRTILLTGPFNDDWLKRLVAAIRARGYRAVTLANPSEKEGLDFVDDSLDLPMSPLTWYDSLASCAGFIGMRFHAYVSCIANNTPAITMDVARPMIGNRDPRNPNYDLARRAGISRNYFIRRDLERTDPGNVLDRLFDPATQARADTFAARAPDLLYGHLAKFDQSAKCRRA